MPLNGLAEGAPAASLGVLDLEAEPIAPERFERLRAWRTQRAEGKPAYTVASNAVLEQILRSKPAETNELLQIKGIGPAFCAKHGESLLQELARM